MAGSGGAGGGGLGETILLARRLDAHAAQASGPGVGGGSGRNGGDGTGGPGPGAGGGRGATQTAGGAGGRNSDGIEAGAAGAPGAGGSSVYEGGGGGGWFGGGSAAPPESSGGGGGGGGGSSFGPAGTTFATLTTSGPQVRISVAEPVLGGSTGFSSNRAPSVSIAEPNAGSHYREGRPAHQAHADAAALWVLLALAIRIAAETIAAYLYPHRLSRVQPRDLPRPGRLQRLVAVAGRTAVFVFVSAVVVGTTWQLWVGAALFLAPEILSIYHDRLPKLEWLSRVRPRGLVELVLVLFVTTAIGALLLSSDYDPRTIVPDGFVLLSLPGFVLSIVELFAADGERPLGWRHRLAGVPLLAVAVAVVLGGVPGCGRDLCGPSADARAPERVRAAVASERADPAGGHPRQARWPAGAVDGARQSSSGGHLSVRRYE